MPNNKNLDEQSEVVDPRAKLYAKALSLLAFAMVIFVAAHEGLDWELLDTDSVDLTFMGGLVLMTVALAFNGQAYAAKKHNY